jgi:hypothetical protein
MTVEICLVEITRFGQKIFFHFDSSKIFAASKKLAALFYSAFSAVFSVFFLGLIMIFICDQKIVAT